MRVFLIVCRVLTILFFPFCASVNSAEIRANDYKGGGWIELKGLIVSGDAERIAELVKAKNWNFTALYFDSTGGDALEGMRIGLFGHEVLVALMCL